MKCLNQECVNKVTSVAGRRPRLYCSNNCRQKDWQRKQKEKEDNAKGEKIRNSSHQTNHFELTPDQIREKFGEDAHKTALSVLEGQKKLKAAIKPQKQEIIPPKDETSVNPPQNGSEKHPLWKVGDPKENSGAFYLKYDCNNYDELSKLK